MPRGIPKDPNHPRNKKKSDTAVTGAPKRRGRPPGSKNTAKAAVATPTKTPTKFASVLKAARVDNSDHINLVRANITALAGCGPAGIGALNNQIEQLMRLTSAALGDDDKDNVEELQETVRQLATPTNQVAPLPSPPSFAPPPFPPPLSGS